jgi:hypothetical protein
MLCQVISGWVRLGQVMSGYFMLSCYPGKSRLRNVRPV